MSSLLVHPFTLLQGDDIKAVVIAVNTIGEGQQSDPNTASDDTALVQTVPHKPLSTPMRD